MHREKRKKEKQQPELKKAKMTMVRLCHLKVLKKNSELRQITLHILDVCKRSKATYVKQK